MTKKWSIKIYWVTKVWAKWQIILPKEIRSDYNIKVWDTLNIALVDWNLIGIWSKNIIEKKCKEDCKTIDLLLEINIGTKFQFVIPSEIREALKIKTAENFVVVWEIWKWIWIFRNDNMDSFFEFVKKYIKDLNNNN